MGGCLSKQELNKETDKDLVTNTTFQCTSGEEVAEVIIEEEEEEESRNEPDIASRLSPEILEIILLQLITDLQDQYSCAQVCSSWRNVLEPTTPLWVFHKLFPVIQPYMTNNEILQCRLVCHTWKDAIDSYLANEPLTQNKNFSLRSSAEQKKLKQWRASYSFRNIDKMRNFMHTMNTEINPLIGRSVEFSNSTGDYIFWTTVFNFLDHFGKHIWHLTLDRGEGGDHPINGSTRIIRVIHSCLKRVPNLRKLQLTCFYNTHMIYCKENSWECEQLTKDLTLDPFPPLPHLNQVIYNDKLDDPFYIAIQQYSKQLEKFEMLEPRFSPRCLFKLYGEFVTSKGLQPPATWFSNLAQLYICVAHQDDVVQLLELKSPLITLQIKVSYKEVEFNDFLKAFRHFEETLEIVRVEFAGYCYVNWDNCVEINNEAASPLTKLKLLSLHDPPWTLDYLTWFGQAGLKKLHISWSYNAMLDTIGKLKNVCNKKDADAIQIYEWIDNLYESNIWSEVPSIKEVVFEGHTWSIPEQKLFIKYKFNYFRRDYNRFLGGKGETAK